MNRNDLIPHVCHHVDDCGSTHPQTITADTILVGWQCGFEPMVVAVHNIYGKPSPEEAEGYASKDPLKPPFDHDCDYLFVSMDNGHTLTAYELDQHADYSLDEAIQAAMGNECTITTYPEKGGSNYAAIKLDNDPPYSARCWKSCEFYIEVNE